MAPDRMIDVYHADLFADPVGEMRRVYEWLGLDLGDTAATAMAGWMGEDRERQATRPGYRLEDYGLSAADVTSHFEAYLDRHPKLTNPDVRST